MKEKNNPNTPQTKLWNFNFIYFLFISAINTIAFNMISPVLPKYVLSLGATLTVAGTISGLFSITALIVRPFSGVIVDRLNKKWVMIISTVIMGLSVLCYTFSSNIVMLFIFRLIHGTTFAISSTTNIAFASTFIPRNRMGEGIGYLGIGQIISLAIGPNLGLWIMRNLGYSYCFIVAAIISLTSSSFMLLIKYKPPLLEKKEQKQLHFRDLLAIELLPYAAFTMLFSLSNGIVSTFIVLLGEERGISNVSIFFTVNAISLLIVRPFTGKLNDRKGIAYVLIPGYLLAAAGMAFLSRASSTWMIVLAGIFKAFGQGGAQPALQAECIKKLGKNRSGVATSTYYIGADIGQGLGPIIGGIVSTHFSYSIMFAGTSVILMCGIFMFLIYEKIQKKYLNNKDLSS